MSNPNRDKENNNFRNLELEVQKVTRGTSDNFVVEPTIDEVESDTFIALKRFQRVVRLQWMYLNKRKKKILTTYPPPTVKLPPPQRSQLPPRLDLVQVYELRQVRGAQYHTVPVK